MLLTRRPRAATRSRPGGAASSRALAARPTRRSIVVYLGLLGGLRRPGAASSSRPPARSCFCVGHAVHARRARRGAAALGELVERTLQILINTLSFARVGAFALAHAGLSSAIVALMDAADSIVAKALVLVVGNVVVIVLEAMVVSIQTTRLVLFEFFTRFLTARGPRLPPAARAPFHLAGELDENAARTSPPRWSRWRCVLGPRRDGAAAVAAPGAGRGRRPPAPALEAATPGAWVFVGAALATGAVVARRRLRRGQGRHGGRRRAGREARAVRPPADLRRPGRRHRDLRPDRVDPDPQPARPDGRPDLPRRRSQRGRLPARRAPRAHAAGAARRPRRSPRRARRRRWCWCRAAVAARIARARAARRAGGAGAAGADRARPAGRGRRCPTSPRACARQLGLDA